MQISQFQNLTKYKIIIPTIFILSWVCMLLGPSLFPIVYQKISIAVFVYMAYKIFWVFVTMGIVAWRFWGVVGRYGKYGKEEVGIQGIQGAKGGNGYGVVSGVQSQILHGFVIPNYMEDIELISQTLQVLASHKHAKSNYLIFLAMQSHQQNSQPKAQHLLHLFKPKFKLLSYTLHQLQPNEQKGKASNVSWCVQHLQPIFQKYHIDPDSVFLTILDVDSWAPELYFEVVEGMIGEDWDGRYQRIYQPLQIFTRNCLDVPVVTRVYDIFHSFMHMSSMWSYFDITFPLSNYTLSYNLIKRIGFWDTCSDAIAQDFHTTIKAHFKTKMSIKCKPVYIPFNQVNLSTGNGYCADIKARFWQAERHARGVNDLAYCFRMFFRERLRVKGLVLFWFVFETFALIAVFPWMVIAMNYQNKILYRFGKLSPELFSASSITYIFTFTSIFGTAAYFLYQSIKRKSNKLLYNQQNEHILRVLEYPLMFIFIFFFISVPTYVIASFTVLFGNQEYVVAEKRGIGWKGGKEGGGGVGGGGVE